MALDAVVFDFGDTLLYRTGGHRLLQEAAARRGVAVSDVEASTLWDKIQRHARTPEEIARGRDLSEDAHRRCWLALYQPADELAPGISEELYAAERDGWSPYEDTVQVLRALRAAQVPVAVLSDTGFDIRPLFARWGLAEMIDAWILSYERGVAKPAPELFVSACAAVQTRPEAALMVGDNPLTDGGAVDTGMPTLLLPRWPGSGPRGLTLVLELLDHALRD
jgi:FMN phosphatase YigB (HAD superfamily)